MLWRNRSRPLELTKSLTSWPPSPSLLNISLKMVLERSLLDLLSPFITRPIQIQSILNRTINRTNKQAIEQSINQSIQQTSTQSPVYSSINSFVKASFDLFIHSLVLFFLGSSIHPSIHPFLDGSVHSSLSSFLTCASVRFPARLSLSS